MSGSNQLESRSKNSDQELIDEKKMAVERALSRLPEEFQKNLSEYVTKQIDLKLAPSPVTRAELWVHAALFTVCFGVWLAYNEIYRKLTPTTIEFWKVLQDSLFTCGFIWLGACVLSVLHRLQHQFFRLTATMVSLNFLVFGSTLAWHLSATFFFYIQPKWLAAMVSLTFHVLVAYYWILWYAKKVLPTTQISLVKIVTGGVLLLILVNLIIYLESGDSGTERYLPPAQIIPYASRSGDSVDLEHVLNAHFKKVFVSRKRQ